MIPAVAAKCKKSARRNLSSLPFSLSATLSYHTVSTVSRKCDLVWASVFVRAVPYSRCNFAVFHFNQHLAAGVRAVVVFDGHAVHPFRQHQVLDVFKRIAQGQYEIIEPDPVAPANPENDAPVDDSAPAPNKVTPTLAALRGEILDILVTDEATALSLLDAAED